MYQCAGIRALSGAHTNYLLALQLLWLARLFNRLRLRLSHRNNTLTYRRLHKLSKCRPRRVRHRSVFQPVEKISASSLRVAISVQHLLERVILSYSLHSIAEPTARVCSFEALSAGEPLRATAFVCSSYSAGLEDL